nr:RNA-directed DNA polymerase, eukaryota [Tanacetum cinerariifolium]
MSKLDRFLVSENLINNSPNITAISLDRYLSDHRPILLRESGNGGEEEVLRRAKTVNKIQKIEELAQKTKIKWAIEGDENSKFFHGMLNKKRSSMGVRGVMVDGAWVDDPQQVKKEFYDHFSAQFSMPNNKDASILMGFPKKISESKLRGLECEVSNYEIKKAVWDCGTEKAPGPDGFTFGFFQHFWYLIHNEVYDAVRYFFLHTNIPKGCNSSFIALIPKSLNANHVKDFHPISLIGSIYKIIAKILANCLVGVLDDIVNEVQLAFIADRQILDGSFILNEVIQWGKVKKKQALIFKVDFEKAYDSVRWDFLDKVLRKFGFGDKWCKWIQCCLNSSRGSILVNGSPTKEFQFGKGLRQGIKLGGGLVNLSHMFYADDAVFVGQWCENNITTLVHVLDCFYKVFGLRINMSKSKIIRVHVDAEKVNRAAIKLGCLVLRIPFAYLGSIVGGNMSMMHLWNETVDKVKKRLSKWKMNTLSIGCLLTLIKSVLSSTPLYHLSLFKAPMGVLNYIESLRSHFFNGHDIKSKKATWVNWKKALVAKDRGGLGISSLYAMNRGVLMVNSFVKDVIAPPSSTIIHTPYSRSLTSVVDTTRDSRSLETEKYAGKFAILSGRFTSLNSWMVHSSFGLTAKRYFSLITRTVVLFPTIIEEENDGSSARCGARNDRVLEAYKGFVELGFMKLN